MADRYFAQIPMSSEEERDYYTRMAGKFGYKTFSSFAKAALMEKIERGDPLYEALKSIADTCFDTEMWLQEIEQPTEVEADALKLVQIIEQVAIRSKVLKESPDSLVQVPEEMMEEGEDPHQEYRYALVKSDIIDKLVKKGI
jgi:hypothetical protein